MGNTNPQSLSTNNDHVSQQQTQNYSSSSYNNKNLSGKPVSYDEANAQWKKSTYFPPAPGTPDTNNPNKIQSSRNINDIEQYIKSSLSSPGEDMSNKTDRISGFIKAIRSTEDWPISCFACGTGIYDVSAFDTHMEDHWKKERSCPICGAQTVIGFDDHYRSHAKLKNELRQKERSIKQKQEERQAAAANAWNNPGQGSGVPNMRLEPVSIDWNNLNKYRKGSDSTAGAVNSDMNNNKAHISFDNLVKGYYVEAETVVDDHGDKCMTNKDTCTGRKRARVLVQKIEKEDRDVFQSVQQSYLDLWDHSFGHYCFQEQWNQYSKSRFDYTPHQSFDSKSKLSMTGRMSTKRPLGSL